MNHFKHILGVNVPRHASSNVVSSAHCGQHTDLYFKSCQFRYQLLKSDPFSITRKSHGIDTKSPRKFNQNGTRIISKASKMICKQRSKIKSITSSRKTSIDKKWALTNSIEKITRHYSTYQNAKFNSDGTIENHIFQNGKIINGVNCTKNRNSSFVASIEKYPFRSYAEMIADYSETIYKSNTVGILNDGLNFNIHKSPFSTLTTSPLSKNIVNTVEHDKISIERRGSNTLLPVDPFKLTDSSVRHDDVDAGQHHKVECHKTSILETRSKDMNNYRAAMNVSKDEDQSYAKLVNDCSKSMYGIPLADISTNGSAAVMGNTMMEDPLTFATTARNANSENMQVILEKTNPATRTGENTNEQTLDSKGDGWLSEIRSAISDMKSITEKRIARTVNISKSKETKILQFMDGSDNLLNGTVDVHKYKEKYAKNRRLVYQPKKMDKIEKYKPELDLQEHNYSQLNDKILPSSRYFSGATKTSVSSHQKKESTQMPTSNSTGTLEQPQVELRMIPSAKESIVSINVNSIPARIFDSLTSDSKELSVIVKSDQQKQDHLRSSDTELSALTPQSNAKDASQCNNFGPMRISISEESVPVKQIEFSINGKPVSELKSITARTDKLDVLGTMDKIEIRVPFTKDDTNTTTSKTREDDLSKGIDSNIGKILNVQISANLQTPLIKGNTERSHKTEKIVPTKTPNINYFYDSPVKTSQRKTEMFYKDNEQKEKSAKRLDIKSNVVENKTMKKLSTDEMLTRLRTENVKNSTNGILDLNKIMKGKMMGSSKLSNNEKNRVPSKTIPWWSSSNSFNQIKKTEQDCKPVTIQSNIIGKKTASNLIQHSINESLPSKSQDSSSSKTLMKETQSVNIASITTDNFNNKMSHSSKECEKSKPTVDDSSMLKLKSNRENSITIPGIMKNKLKKKDNQMSEIANTKDSNIERSKSSTSFVSEIKNTQNEYSAKFNNYVTKRPALPNTSKASSSIQELPSKRNLEKDSHLLNQTKSNDNISVTKSRTENILDTIKPIEKKKDGTLIDYGVKISSRKPGVRVSNNITTIGNLSPTKPKDSASNKSTVEIKPKSSAYIESSPGMTSIQKSAELKNSESKKYNQYPSKEYTKKKILETTNKENEKIENKLSSTQDKSKPTPKSKQDTISNSPRIVTRHPASKSSLPNNNENDNRQKPKLDQKNPSESSSGASKKSGGPKSSDPDTCMKFMITTNDKCTYTRNLLFVESSYANLNRHNDIVSRSAMFRATRNLNDREASVTGNDRQWGGINRPEKDVLYAAWLQQFKNDVNNNKKLL